MEFQYLGKWLESVNASTYGKSISVANIVTVMETPLTCDVEAREIALASDMVLHENDDRLLNYGVFSFEDTPSIWAQVSIGSGDIWFYGAKQPDEIIHQISLLCRLFDFHVVTPPIIKNIELCISGRGNTRDEKSIGSKIKMECGNYLGLEMFPEKMVVRYAELFSIDAILEQVGRVFEIDGMDELERARIKLKCTRI